MKKLFSRFIVGILLSTLIVPVVFINSVPVAHAQTAVDLSTNPYTESVSWTAGYYETYEVTGIPLESTLYVNITGVSGAENPDIDMYDSTFDEYSGSYLPAGTNEYAQIFFPQDGPTATYTVDIYDGGLDAFAGDIEIGYTLDAQPEIFTEQEITYTFTGTPGTQKEYKIYVPTGADYLYMDAVVSSGSPVTDFYMNQGSPVAFDNTDDCYPGNQAVDDACEFNTPTGGGYYYIGIEESSGTGSILLVGDVIWGTLTDEVAETGITSNGAPYEYIYYYFDVPAGASTLEFTTTSNGAACDSWSGDVILYALNGDWPLSNNYYGIGVGNEGKSDQDLVEMCDESISISNPPSGSWYVGLAAGNGTNFDDVSLTAHYTVISSTTILNGEGGTTGTITDTNYEYFKITIPSGASDLEIATSGGTGTSADLYHKYNGFPTTSSNDNNSVTGGTNTESITVAGALTAGDHYIGVYGNGGTVDSVNLTANFTNGTLTKSIDETNLDVSLNEWEHYTIDVPSGATDLTLTTSGGTGDVSLYTKYNAYPTAAVNDGSSTTGSSNTESIVIASPSTGTYYVSILGSAASTGVTLNADYTSNIPSTTLFNGETDTGIEALAGEYVYYDVPIPSTSSELFAITDNDGAEDTLAVLYQNFNIPPTISAYDNQGYSYGTSNQQYVYAYDYDDGDGEPAAGTHYLGLYSHTHISHAPGFTGVNLTSKWIIEDLSKGTDVTGIGTTNAGEWAFYYLDIDDPLSNISNLVITTTDTDDVGDISLYVEDQNSVFQANYNDYPTTYPSPSATYSSVTASENNETVNIASPVDSAGRGVYRIGIYSATTFDGVTLNANWTADEQWEETTMTGTPSTGGALEIERDLNGDYMILASGGIYKLSGTNWDLNTSTISGSDVAISGDKAVVGTGGTVRTYERNGGGTWDLNAQTLSGGANFGDSVDISGDYLVVSDNDYGSYGDELNADVFVYKWNATQWDTGTVQTLNESGGGAGTGEDFGQSVAINGTTVVIGAPYYKTAGAPFDHRGKAYFFDISSFPVIGAAQEVESNPGSIGTENRFGDGVDIEGSYAIVSAYYGLTPDFNSGTGPGTIEVFYNDGGTWTFHQELDGIDANNDVSTSGDGFGRGRNLAINQEFIIGGTKTWDNNDAGGFNAQLSVFKRNSGAAIGSQWEENLHYRAPGDSTSGIDGVTIHGNDYLAGAGNTDPAGPPIILLGNAPAGSGGGSGVPEFRDYIYLFTILIVFALMLKLVPKITPQRTK